VRATDLPSDRGNADEVVLLDLEDLGIREHGREIAQGGADGGRERVCLAIELRVEDAVLVGSYQRHVL
jgi:hypothetical protein